MKNLTSKLNNFAQNVKTPITYIANNAKDIVDSYMSHPIRNTLLAVGVASTIACVNPSTNPYDSVDVNATEIILNGDNPYMKFIGDDYIEAGAIAKNSLGNERTVSIKYANFDPDGDGVENAGDFVVKYTADEISKERDVKNNIETGLEAVMNAESNTPGKTAMEVANAEGFYLNRGSNDNVADNIEGTYDIVGSWINSNGVGTSYSYSVEVSNQNGFSIDFDWDIDSVITGVEENKASVSGFLDDDFDGENDRTTFTNIDILSNGILNIKKIRIPLGDNILNEEWSKHIETWTPVTN